MSRKVELIDYFTISCQDRSYGVRKTKLLKESPTFRRLISRNWDIEDIVIPLEDPSGLDAIATHLNNKFGKRFADIDEFLSAFAAAHWLGLSEFKSHVCQNQMAGFFEKENIMKLLVYAFNTDDEHYKELFFGFLATYFTDVWRTVAENCTLPQMEFIMKNLKYNESCRSLAFLVTWAREDVKSRYKYFLKYIKNTDMTKLRYATLVRQMTENPMFCRFPKTRRVLINKTYFDHLHLMYNNNNIVQEYRKSKPEQFDRISYSTVDSIYKILKIFPYKGEIYAVVSQELKGGLMDVIIIKHIPGQFDQKICIVRMETGKIIVGAVGSLVIFVIPNDMENLSYMTQIAGFNILSRLRVLESDIMMNFMPNVIACSRRRVYLMRYNRRTGFFDHIVRFMLTNGSVTRLPTDCFAGCGGDQRITCYNDRLIVFLFEKTGHDTSRVTYFRESGDEWEPSSVQAPWGTVNRLVHYHDQYRFKDVVLPFYPYVHFLGDFWQMYHFNPETKQFRKTFVSFNLPLGTKPGKLLMYCQQYFYTKDD